ncbi:membrane protein, putative [Sulfurimonas denitrificans DSM 1251]|uniref:Membrane protein, putative n=1 Tax=Sulfurimonas denitrificans (strain ATCC 33889 / DSM 1251) TaxID=326298 RepID=Q30SK8_SULDN|nr:EI24 domain-containing protein [Sulfurimonas denitrificans]ABB44023.1 membrane protein, putative [Sulfurimonas denitrificans DSM 1251]MDD3443153.1 EI24 domain-containing protein [Sulfurimonas denitrificans]
MSEKEILLRSIKDFLTPKMLKYSILPFIISLVVLYIVFFVIAGIGVEHLSTLNVESSQTTIVDGVPHTENFNATLSDSSMLKFLMHYAISSWLAAFFIYALGAFLAIYFSIFLAVIIIGFLTPSILRELQKSSYSDISMIGYSNLPSALFLALKSALIMILLFILLIPFYFIPFLNIIALNLPMYYFFHKMLLFDVSSSICTKEEAKNIAYFKANNLRLKTALLYLISLVPFAIFFVAIFFVIYLGHTYFLATRELREPQ